MPHGHEQVQGLSEHREEERGAAESGFHLLAVPHRVHAKDVIFGFVIAPGKAFAKVLSPLEVIGLAEVVVLAGNDHVEVVMVGVAEKDVLHARTGTLNENISTNIILFIPSYNCMQ